jgi:hypothetical protein
LPTARLLLIFRDDPHIYNPISYFICGAILLVWSFNTLRWRFSSEKVWLALRVIAPLAMLFTYHRAKERHQFESHPAIDSGTFLGASVNPLPTMALDTATA